MIEKSYRAYVLPSVKNQTVICDRSDIASHEHFLIFRNICQFQPARYLEN